MTRRWRTLALLTCAALLTACTSGASAEQQVEPPLPTATAPSIAPDVLAQRGMVLETSRFDSISDPIAEMASAARRIVYNSTSGIDGSLRRVTGSVFVPKGDPPPGGWPIITYGHGTTGVSNGCGPSLFPDLLGYDLVVASLLKLGFVVALTDYEGLGPSGVHPLFEPKTAAFNMIDAVRAARQATPGASDRWLAFGVSQGGQAAWAASEWAANYGDGLTFLGAAALSPAANMSGLARLASSGWLSHDDQALLPMTLTGLKVTHPDLVLGDYLHGPLADNPAMWLACAGPDVANRLTVAATLDRHASEPSSPQAADKLERALADLAVPQRRAAGPLLVITGEADTVVRPQWVRDAVHVACRLGDTVEFVVRPGEGHDNLQGGDQAGVWLLDRVAGKPPPNNC